MRRAELADLPAIRAGLAALLEKSPARQMKFASLDKAMASITTALAESRAWIMGGYFILVDVGSDWYTSAEFLIEQLILKIDPSDKSCTVQYVATEGLSAIAAHFGVQAIIVGDTQIGYMTPIYHAAGFTTLGTQLMKET